MLHFERLIVILCLISPFVYTQLTPEQYASIQDVVRQVMERNHIPGLGLAIVYNGATTTEGFGVRDIETGLPVTADTLFCVASLTKGFTGVLASKHFVENGLLFERPINDIIPEFLLFSDRYRTEDIMMKDLLSHRTCLDSGVLPTIFDVFEDVDDVLRRIPYFGEVCPVRSRLEYNNYGYLLAGRVLEKLTNTPWSQLVKDQIFTPLEMENSTFVSDVIFTTDDINMAKSYYWNETHLVAVEKSLLRRMSSAYPAGDIVSSANDMAKWLSFILTKGLAPSGVPLVDPAVIDIATKAYILATNLNPVYLPDSEIDIDYGYAAGFYLGTRKGYFRLEHTGTFTNYLSRLTIFPDLKLGILTTTNGPSPLNEQDVIHNFIMDTVLEGPPANIPPSKKVLNTDAPAYLDELKAINNSELYVGTYGSWAFGNVTIQYEDEGLTYIYGREGYGKLIPILGETNLFRLEVPRIVVFEVNQPLFFRFHPNNATDASPGDAFRYIHCLSSPNLWFERNLKLEDAPARLWNATDC